MVIIHGANSAAAEMAPFIDALRPYTSAVAQSLPGHGGRPLDRPMTVPAFAADIVAYMDREGIDRTILAGYSFGGAIALYIARHWPQRVSGVVALATKSETIHAPNAWQDVARANAALFATLGESPPLSDADLAAIRVPVMIASSNVDQIVPWSESIALAKRIPGSHVAMFYGPAHPIRAAPLLAIARAIGEWMRANGLQ